MKRHLYFLFMILMPCQLWAQVPTIYNMQLNPSGMVAKFLLSDTAGITAGSSGANVTWNLASWGPLNSSNDTFYEWTIPAYPGSLAPAASRIDSIQSVIDVGGNSYINQTTGKTYLLDLAYSSSSSSAYSTPSSGHLIAEQPITYLNSFGDTFSYTVTTGSANATYNCSSITTVDGYGTLTLPNGTFTNVLRTTTMESDTNSTQTSLIYNTIVYQWYDEFHSVPLCYMYSTAAGARKVYYYLLSQTPGVSVTNVKNEATEFSACFSGNSLMLNCKFNQGSSYSLSMFNMSGQKVYSNSFNPSGNNASFNIDNWLCPGMYIVGVIDNNTHAFNTIKVVKE
jgi:hypothetical protein